MAVKYLLWLNGRWLEQLLSAVIYWSTFISPFFFVFLSSYMTWCLLNSIHVWQCYNHYKFNSVTYLRIVKGFLYKAYASESHFNLKSWEFGFTVLQYSLNFSYKCGLLHQFRAPCKMSKWVASGKLKNHVQMIPQYFSFNLNLNLRLVLEAQHS